MALLPLQKNIIYGPVNSRRLGRSLGINLLPTTFKLCSFDCVYCHYGRTPVKSLFPEENLFPRMDRVTAAVEKALSGPEQFDYITFSGNGEPTLHPHFAEIAVKIRRLRDRLRPKAKLAILSNSSTAHLDHIQKALGLFDRPILKLDAGDIQTFREINRPASGVRLEQIVEGLTNVRGLEIQSVLIDGKVSNIWDQAYEAWISTLSHLRPTHVQIYSTDRPVPETSIQKVSPLMLQRIAREVEERTGLRINTYWT